MACETTQGASLLVPAAGFQLNPVELARIDYRAVDGYQGSFFPDDLIAATTDQARLILEVTISKVGDEPEMPRWVADYEARDFEPGPLDTETTMGETGWLALLMRTTWGGVVSEKMVANAALSCANDIRTTQELRRLDPEFSMDQARVVRAALGFTAATGRDPITRLEASIARLRYADVPQTPADRLLHSGHMAVGLLRRVAALTF